jgi:hypothetical protein
MKQISLYMAVIAVLLFSCNAEKDKKVTAKENPQLAAKHLDAVADQNKNKAGLSNLANNRSKKNTPGAAKNHPMKTGIRKLSKQLRSALS